MKKDRQPKLSARDVQFDSQLAKLADRITKLEIRKNQPSENFQLHAKLEGLERSIRQLEHKQSEKPATSATKVSLDAVKIPPKVLSQPEVDSRSVSRSQSQLGRPVESIAFYARTADLGDGFSSSGLLKTPARDTVFDINLQNDTQATYQVSENAYAQRLALEYPYSYLHNACEYINQPNQNSLIRTEQPGHLTLQGDKWKIMEKAKIRFI